jgi:hypothetical protein
MARSTHGRLALAAAVLAVLGWWATTLPSLAQQEESATDRSASAADEEPAKPRGRLPAFFGDVVTPEQRDEIYAIQAEYAPQIERLRAELKQVVDERDAKVDEVLTAKQWEEVRRLREEGRQQAADDAEAAAEEAAERAVLESAPRATDAPPPATRPRRTTPKPRPE